MNDSQDVKQVHAQKMDCGRVLMNKKTFFLLLSFFALSNTHGDIPQNVTIGDKSGVVYEVIDKEKCKITVTIDNAKYEDMFYYAMIAENETSTIPLPVYLGTYKNAVILLKGCGFSYRNLIVYQKVKNSIVKKEYENSLAYLPRENEKYVFMYDSNPILAISASETLNFVKINKEIKGDVSGIKIFGDEIVINIEKTDEKIIIETERRGKSIF